MTPEQHHDFPEGRQFLATVQADIDRFSTEADRFAESSGEKLPATVEGTGTVLSILYRLACCAWGCRGGDHQVEWLSGRIVNQTISAHRLVRAGYYDEALMLIRGIGELANLIWLFKEDADEMKAWKVADRKVRITQFGPGAVRTRLEKLSSMGPPIDRERYSRLCEVATHPVPAMPPGHFTGTGRPILGALIQPVGIYVSMTELGFAVAMAAVPLSALLEPEEAVRSRLFTQAVQLTRNLGAFTILNYDELLAEVYAKTKP